MELKQMAEKINEALKAKGYKPEEARANAWTKEIKPGQIVERIYLNGKKAAGYVHLADGAWKREGINFSLLHQIVGEAIQ